MKNDEKSFQTLTPKLFFLLTSPHTWVASIIPVLVGTALAFSSLTSQVAGISLNASLEGHHIDPVMCAVLLAICICFQSSVNILNDYFDFKKGTDTVENQLDPNDAVLVYNNIDPRQTILLVVLLILAGFVLGIYVIYSAGWVPFFIAIIGVLVIFFYSGGKHPISYLPFGELASGFTMGGLIILACFYSFTQTLSLMTLYYAIPIIAGIALIMATNNTCDIEKDVAASRKTFAVLVGRKKAVQLCKASAIIWHIALILISLQYFRVGFPIVILAILAVLPSLKKLLENDLTQNTRRSAFSCITKINTILGLGYAIAIALNGMGGIV